MCKNRSPIARVRFVFGKMAWGPSRLVPFSLVQKLFAIPTVYWHLFLSTIERADAASKLGQPADYPS